MVVGGIAHGRDDPIQHGAVRNTMMRLWTEEEFDVACTVAGTARKHFVGHAVEVVSIDNGAADDVVGFEKLTQIGKVK
jgi:hypothetical protein